MTGDRQLPPARHGSSTGRPRLRPGISLLRLLGWGLVVVVVAGAAGLWFGRADPQRAARVVVSEFVVEEDNPEPTPGPDPEVPTSVSPEDGEVTGDPRCGVLDEPLEPEAQVEILAAGVVLIQYGAEAPDDQIDALTELATERDRVALAPNPELDEPIVATSWRQRLDLEGFELDLYDAFAIGHADRSPDVQPCPDDGAGAGA